MRLRVQPDTPNADGNRPLTACHPTRHGNERTTGRGRPDEGDTTVSAFSSGDT